MYIPAPLPPGPSSVHRLHLTAGLLRFRFALLTRRARASTHPRSCLLLTRRARELSSRTAPRQEQGPQPHGRPSTPLPAGRRARVALCSRSHARASRHLDQGLDVTSCGARSLPCSRHARRCPRPRAASVLLLQFSWRARPNMHQPVALPRPDLRPRAPLVRLRPAPGAPRPAATAVSPAAPSYPCARPQDSGAPSVRPRPGASPRRRIYRCPGARASSTGGFSPASRRPGMCLCSSPPARALRGRLSSLPCSAALRAPRASPTSGLLRPQAELSRPSATRSSG
jgi:hypothetical protein